MTFNQPVPELPVPDVAEAQAHYAETFGFDIAWHDAEGGIGAVALGATAVFFRQSGGPYGGARFWVFAEDVDGTHAELAARGADISAPPEDKPWGLRQFTVKDAYGNTFTFHHDL